jgi:hypothetical protein
MDRKAFFQKRLVAFEHKKSSLHSSSPFLTPILLYTKQTPQLDILMEGPLEHNYMLSPCNKIPPKFVLFLNMENFIFIACQS